MPLLFVRPSSYGIVPPLGNYYVLSHAQASVVSASHTNLQFDILSLPFKYFLVSCDSHKIL